MRKAAFALVGLAAAVTLVGLSPVGPRTASAQGRSATPRSATVISTQSPIKHVIIIYQENHSFDDVLGAYCQTRANPCNGYTGPVTFADGNTAANIVEPDVVPAADHSPKSQRYALHNEWDKVGDCGAPRYQCVTHQPASNIPNLASLADTFTVSDATFAAGKGSSFGAHVTLGGGTFDGFVGGNPVRSRTGAKPREGWGCSSHRDELWGPRGDHSYQPSCIPDHRGKGPYRTSLVAYTPTIMQRMEQAGYSWHIYEGDDNDKPLIGPWSICTYYAWCALHRFETRYDSKRPDFLSDAAAGTLPNLSILLPTGSTPIGGVSQHNGNSMRLGDNYIGQYVAAAMSGPEWDSTAIFITYDDCGCFYDHVKPPAHLGIRNPMVIVSPWAKPQGTDSTVAVQPYSMLSFTEHVFGLKQLTPKVTKAYDYANSFDFSQQPITKVPTMVQRPIPQSEKVRLAKLAPLEADDPT